MILIDRIVTLRCRSPCGERGLKYICPDTMKTSQYPSLPVRGAWVEITRRPTTKNEQGQSLPVRGAWVEMLFMPMRIRKHNVAPRAGSVG